MIAIQSYCPGCGQPWLDEYDVVDYQIDWRRRRCGVSQQDPICDCDTRLEVDGELHEALDALTDWIQRRAEQQLPPLPAHLEPPDHRTY